MGVARCDKHKKAGRKSGTKYTHLYTHEWSDYSKRRLRQYPLCACEECQEGRVRATPAEVTDHIVPHKGDLGLFWDPSNHQSLSKSCHDRKTAREDGGFGNLPTPTNT